MADWYPGATRRPGFNAGYRNGRNRMQLCVAHFTVGRDSAPVGDRGYFNFLVRRNGEVVQFAEVDALTWHAGTANAWGPGIEVEYLPGVDPEIWTPPQRDAVAHLVEWLISAGIPETFYDGPRIDPAGFHGFLTHRSVAQPDGHSDWWPELPRAAQKKEKKRRMNPGLFVDTNGAVWVYDPNNKTKTWVTGPDELSAIQALRAVNGLPVDVVRNATTDALLAGAVEIKKGQSGGSIDLSNVTVTGSFTGHVS